MNKKTKKILKEYRNFMDKNTAYLKKHPAFLKNHPARAKEYFDFLTEKTLFFTELIKKTELRELKSFALKNGYIISNLTITINGKQAKLNLIFKR
jgi:hypothetical protein